MNDRVQLISNGRKFQVTESLARWHLLCKEMGWEPTKWSFGGDGLYINVDGQPYRLMIDDRVSLNFFEREVRKDWGSRGDVIVVGTDLPALGYESIIPPRYRPTNELLSGVDGLEVRPFTPWILSPLRSEYSGVRVLDGYTNKLTIDEGLYSPGELGTFYGLDSGVQVANPYHAYTDEGFDVEAHWIEAVEHARSAIVGNDFYTNTRTLTCALCVFDRATVAA